MQVENPAAPSSIMLEIAVQTASPATVPIAPPMSAFRVRWRGATVVRSEASGATPPVEAAGRQDANTGGC